MLHAPQSPSGTFRFIYSEDDNRRIEDYHRQNEAAVDRMLELIEQTPGIVRDGYHVFRKPIWVTVTDTGFTASPKPPRRKDLVGPGTFVQFEICERRLGERSAEALTVAHIVGCMRISNLLSVNKRLAKIDQEAARGLLMQFVSTVQHQVYSAAHHMTKPVPQP